MKFPLVSLFSSVICIHSLFHSAIVIAQQAADSCGANLNLDGLGFDASLLQCAGVWPQQDFILRYARTDSNQWSFVLSAPDSDSYIAIGFSTNGQMIGSSAIVGWIASGGSGTVKQYFLGGKTPQQVILNAKNLEISNSSMKIVSQSSRLYLSFQLTTADQPRPSLLYALGRPGAIPVSPGYELTEHRFMVTTSMNYNTGIQRALKRPYSRLRRSHGLLNMFSWGMLMMIGAMAARYLKKWEPMWFYAHASVQTFGFALGLIGIVCGLVLENRTKASVSTHKGLGISILVLGSLQVLALLVRPGKDSKYRKYWNWYHHNIGRVQLILAVSNVFYGIHVGKAGTAWRGGYGFVVGVLFLAAAVLEARLWMKK